MQQVAAQLRGILGRLLYRSRTPLDPSAHQSGYPETLSSRTSREISHQHPSEYCECTILPLIAIADVFKITTSDSLAFPDTALNLRTGLLQFPLGRENTSAQDM